MTLDPRYALAWSALAMAHAASPINSDVAPLDVWPRARAAAMEAVRTGPDLAEAQFAFGYVNWLFDWVGPPPSARHTTASRLRFGPTRWRKQAAPATRGPHLIASRQSREALCAANAFALVHAGLGQRDAVFDWLERACAARDVHLMFLTVDPKWDPYRADPRFIKLLARCGFAAAARPLPGNP